MSNAPIDRLRGQRGAALMTVLVVLFILTVLGMLALSTAGVDVRLAANERDYQQALYAAEGGIAHMRAILQSKLVSANQARLSAGQLPVWSFALVGPEGIAPAGGGGFTANLAGYQYRVYVYDSGDTDGNDADGNDADGLIMVRSDVTGPGGTRASVEMMLSATGTAESLTGYGGQAGGGQGKSHTGDDTSAITDTTVNNLGNL